MTTVSILKAGIRGFANAVKKTAVNDKKFAEELVYMHGIRSNITPNALRKSGLTKDLFDKGGKLTQKGQNEVKGIIQDLDLPKNASWYDVFKAIRKYKDAIPKLEMPKFPELKI